MAIVHVLATVAEKPLLEGQAVQTSIYLKREKEREKKLKNCKALFFFVKSTSVLLPPFTVVLCTCFNCVINKVNASPSAGTYIKEMVRSPFVSERLLGDPAPTCPVVFAQKAIACCSLKGNVLFSPQQTSRSKRGSGAQEL